MLLAAAPLAAQRDSAALRLPVVRGRLIDAETGRAVTEGSVRLLWGGDVAVSTLSGDDGAFVLVAPRPGAYRLRVGALGYGVADEPLHLRAGDTVRIDVRLGINAIELDSLTAIAPTPTRGAGLAGMQSFFERYARLSGSPFAEFMTRDSLALWEQRVQSTGHMLQWTTRSVQQVDPVSGEVTLRGGCRPAYYLNGTRVSYLMVEPLTPELLEAVEVYVRPAIPAELSQGAPCGVISLWSRRSPPDTPPKSRVARTLGIVATALGIVLLVTGTIQ
ncbi:MAG TPA: carboxypeptidase-like regulatory domain-containing protein [Longimicrobiales bacterium]